MAHWLTESMILCDYDGLKIYGMRQNVFYLKRIILLCFFFVKFKCFNFFANRLKKLTYMLGNILSIIVVQ